MKNETKKSEIFLHRFFKVAIFIKGMDGILEIIASLVLIFLPVAKIIPFLIGGELIEDSKDVVANYLAKISENLLPDSQLFLIIYLSLHGLIKIGLVWALQGKNAQAYKGAGMVLGIFVAYQFYRYSHTGSLMLLFFTLLDIAIIFLIYHEYKKILNKE